MNGRQWYRVTVVSAMKFAALVVIASAMALSGARAEDASAKNPSAGNCMPIGLTASGELVFPWDCREVIEKQRGPVSLSVPGAPADASPKDQGAEKDAPPEQAVDTPAAASQVPPQLATATDHALDTHEATAPAVRRVHRHHQKRQLAAIADKKRPLAAPIDKKRQVAAQPAPAATSSLRALFSR